MKVISTDLLIRTATEASFEKDTTTDIEHVLDFLKLMNDNYGFELVQCKDCKYFSWHTDSCERRDGMVSEKFFCAEGEKKDV